MVSYKQSEIKTHIRYRRTEKRMTMDFLLEIMQARKLKDIIKLMKAKNINLQLHTQREYLSK